MKFSKLPPSVSTSQGIKILQVINVFETGTKEGKYDAFVAYADFSYKGNNYMQITYGRSQTTEFGNLKKLIEMYIYANGVYKTQFQTYLPQIGIFENNIPKTLCKDIVFVNLLKEAANNDAIMRDVQDTFFDNYYFQPAVAWFTHYGFTLPLSLLVIYDSFIHSGGIFSFLRERFSAFPPSMNGDEKDWIKQYTETRNIWLEHHSKPVVRLSQYRTKCLLNQIENNNWDLTQTISTQGVNI